VWDGAYKSGSREPKKLKFERLKAMSTKIKMGFYMRLDLNLDRPDFPYYNPIEKS